MTRILFWNIDNRPLLPELSQLASEKSIDIIVLAEDSVSLTKRLRTLNSTAADYFVIPLNCERIRIFSRFSDRLIRPLDESEYHSACEVHLPAVPSFLLFAIHWKSLMWRSANSQSLAFPQIARLITEVERRQNHQRTILVGDLNADPFDSGVISGTGLHSTMSRKIAQRGSREISPFGTFPFFYNPMWSVFGDENDGPPGTYYRADSQEVCQFWHAFDQFLIRPALIPWLPKKSVTVISQVGVQSLLSERGIPSLSDHLPIMVEFNPPPV